MRNPRHDRTIEIVRTAKRLRKLLAKPNFKSFTIFGPDLVAVEMSPTEIKLQECVFAGSTILDTSKMTVMRRYWQLKEHFGDRMEVLFSDTDSICIEVTTSDLDGDLKSLEPILDFSGLPAAHPLYTRAKARVPGLLKLEYGEFNIMTFCGLRSKCYCLELETLDGTRVITVAKCKGVQKCALKRSAGMSHYKECLFQNFNLEVKFCSIRTDGKHNLFTQEQTKVALRNFDNKRFICDCGVKTRGYIPPPPIQEDNEEPMDEN